MKTKCLITGCYLVDGSNQSHVYGDLHSIGESYVFNACNQMNYGVLDPNARALIINPMADFFHRRDVYVVPMASAQLNPAAKEFLK